VKGALNFHGIKNVLFPGEIYVEKTSFAYHAEEKSVIPNPLHNITEIMFIYLNTNIFIAHETPELLVPLLFSLFQLRDDSREDPISLGHIRKEAVLILGMVSSH